MIKGQPTTISLPDGTRCADVFEKEGTPFLLDTSNVERVSAFLANLNTFASDAYAEFVTQMKDAPSSWTSKTPLSTLSPQEKVAYYKFRAATHLKEAGAYFYKKTCVDGLVNLIQEDTAVLLGVRSKSRFERETKLGKEALILFGAFLNSVNDQLKDHLSDIDILPDIDFHDSGDIEGYAIYMVNLAQHEAIYKAHFGKDEAVSTRELLGLETDHRNPPYYYFNGHMYRIPIEAVRDATPPRTYEKDESVYPFYVTGNFYFQATQSRSAELGPWKDCVSEYFSSMNNEVMPKQTSFMTNIFGDISGWVGWNT